MKSVYKSPRSSLACPPQYPLRTCLWTQTRRRRDISYAKFVKPSGRDTHVRGQHAFSIWVPGAEARQLPAALSDTCGRNVGRGRQRARAELQHGFSLKSRRASRLRPQTQRAQTVVSAAQLSLPLAPSSDRLLRSVFSCLFPPRWSAAGGCGRRLEPVGTLAAVLQDVRGRGGVLPPGVHRPRASERRQVLRGPEGSVPVLQHAGLSRPQR